jgi:hypothetical protein
MSPQLEILPSIDASVLSQLQNPVLHGATRRVELDGIPINFQEDFLHQVFGFSTVPQDTVSNAENQAIVPIKENRQGVRYTASELQQKILVSQIHQGKGSHLESTVPGMLRSP